MPVNRLKLLAFMFGAAIAGLAGCIFASVQTGGFPGNFDAAAPDHVYAMVILGGAGSMPGVVIGAITINVSPELLREPATNARFLFYVAIGLGARLTRAAVAEARCRRSSAWSCSASSPTQLAERRLARVDGRHVIEGGRLLRRCSTAG